MPNGMLITAVFGSFYYS